MSACEAGSHCDARKNQEENDLNMNTHKNLLREPLAPWVCAVFVLGVCVNIFACACVYECAFPRVYMYMDVDVSALKKIVVFVRVSEPAA